MELDGRVSQLEAQIERINNKMFGKEKLRKIRDKVHEIQKAKMLEVADQVKAINDDSNLDGKQKKDAIKELEGLARKDMEKINEEANKEAESLG